MASGYTGVWATGNSRAELWDAMHRRETYGTTGPRMTVRVFGGWDFKPGDDRRSDYVALGYDKGVPMGGVLRGDPQAAAVRKAFETGETAETETLTFLGYGTNAPGNPDDAALTYRGIAAEIAKQQKSPTFLVAALMDPMGGTLDRIQMVKGWRDSEGELHEKVYDSCQQSGRIRTSTTRSRPFTTCAYWRSPLRAGRPMTPNALA